MRSRRSISLLALILISVKALPYQPVRPFAESSQTAKIRQHGSASRNVKRHIEEASRLYRRAPTEEACPKNQDCIEYDDGSNLSTPPFDSGFDMSFTTAPRSMPTSMSPSGGESATGLEAFGLDNIQTLAAPPKGPLQAGLSIWAAKSDVTDLLDFGFFIDVQIGTPARDFALQIDIASADTWVMGEDCAGCGNQPRHGPTTSSTFKVDNSIEGWADEYSSATDVKGANGQASGILCKDTFAFTANVTLENFKFGIAEMVTDDFGDSRLPFSGVLGLANSYAWPDISSQHIEPPVVSLNNTKPKQIPFAQVAIQLGRSSDETNTGEIAFGGVVSRLYEGELTLINNVNPNGFWEVPVDTITQGEEQVLGRSAILDTRTALILAPGDDIIALFSNAPSAYFDPFNGLLLNCNTTYNLSLTIGGTAFPIHPSDLIFAPAKGDATTLCGSPPCCYSAVQAVPSSLGLGTAQWIFGAAALKSFYFALDYESNLIGLAKSRFSTRETKSG